MKIITFCQYYYPEPFLIHDIMEELVRRGHEVTVITGVPNYSSGSIYSGYDKGKDYEEEINGVRVIRCNIKPRGKSISQLFFNYISYAKKATKCVKKIPDSFDVCFCYQLTPITQLYPAIKFARKRKIPLISYNLDLAPMSGGAKAKRFLSKPYSWFSKWSMNACNHILVTSESFIEYNNHVNKVPTEKMEYLPQHASESLLDIDMTSMENGIADFMFAGNIAGGIRHQTIVKAAKLLKHKAVFMIHIVGDGSALETFKQDVSNEGLEDVFTFWGRQARDDMPSFYAKADALLITLRKGQITIPGKLQTYMTTGKPILGAMDGSGREIIESAKCGLCVPAEDYEGLATIMLKYIESKDQFCECGKNSREYFKKHFTFTIFMQRFEATLKKIADEQK